MTYFFAGHYNRLHAHALTGGVTFTVLSRYTHASMQEKV